MFEVPKPAGASISGCNRAITATPSAQSFWAHSKTKYENIHIIELKL
jgi:hypothetical protein